MDLDVSLRDTIIIIKLSIHQVQFNLKKKKKLQNSTLKFQKILPHFPSIQTIQTILKIHAYSPHTNFLSFSISRIPPTLQFSSLPLLAPLSKGRLICDRCQNLNSYGPFEHYYALLLPGATRRSLRSQCIRRRPPWVSRQGWTMSPSHDRFPPHPAEKLSSLFSGDKSRRSVRLILCGFADGLQIGCGRSV